MALVSEVREGMLGSTCSPSVVRVSVAAVVAVAAGVVPVVVVLRCCGDVSVRGWLSDRVAWACSVFPLPAVVLVESVDAARGLLMALCWD